MLIGPAIGGLFTDSSAGPGCSSSTCRWAPSSSRGVAQPAVVPPGSATVGSTTSVRRLFTAALVPILVGLTNKRTAEWTDPTVGGLIASAPSSRSVFLVVESRARSRSCRSSLFRNRTFTVSVVALFLVVVRVPRRGRVPAALVPGGQRLVRDRVRLPDPAAARRADRQRDRSGSDRQPDRSLQAARVRRAGHDGGRAVPAHQPAGGHARSRSCGSRCSWQARCRTHLRACSR